MYKSIEYEEILAAGTDKYIFVDLRSPKEHAEATIPGSVNIPLFTDEERHEIGIIYNQVSVEKAKMLGVQIVSAKLPGIYEQITVLKQKGKNIVVFCARGGMRSSSLVSLFSSLGVGMEKLKGGYKSYRRCVFEKLPEVNCDVDYIVLHGNTGVGKTLILSELKELGYDILDLEQCANNRGSLLGSVGLGASFSQKQFDALIFDALRLRKTRHVFVEAESKRVGNITVPDYVFDKMKNGIHIKLTADIKFRAMLLTNEYTGKQNCDEEIRSALDNLRKYIGEENRERFDKMLCAKQYEQLSIELMQKYYDPMYENESRKYSYSLELCVESIDNSVEQICKWFDGFMNMKEKPAIE